MKIVFVSHSPGTGGAEHSLATLVAEALRRGHECVVSLPSGDDRRILSLFPSSEHLRIYQHRWVRMMQGAHPRLTGPLRVVIGIRDAYKFATWLRQERIDVVLVNSTTIPQASFAAFIARIPAVTMIREAIRTNPALPSFLPKRLIAWLIRRFSVRTVAVSKYAGDQLRFATDVVHPEVPLMRASVSSGERRGLRLVMAGTLSAEKGQRDAVEAVRLARQNGVEIYLDLYGQASPERLQELNSAIAVGGLTGIVEHRGESRSMMQLFAAADATLVCSGNEAFGRVTAESINAGTPVIGYNRGGTSEILMLGGGVLCDPNPHSLSEAITTIARDREALIKLREACEQRILAGGAGGHARAVLELIEAASSLRRGAPA